MSGLLVFGPTENSVKTPLLAPPESWPGSASGVITVTLHPVSVVLSGRTL